MAQTTYSDTELLTEHFGYPPVSLLDDIINSINILAERALNSVEQGLLNAPPATLGFKPPPLPTTAPSRSRIKPVLAPGPEDGASIASPEEQARHEIENGTHQLETLLCASIDRDFDKFELYVMRNILTVKAEDRSWIRLGHYQGLDFAALEEGHGTADKPSLESVNGLRRRLLASQQLNGMLHAERTRNGALLAELRRITGRSTTKRESDGLGDPAMEESTRIQQQAEDKSEPAPLAFLRDKGSLTEGDAEKPLSTTTAFTLSQLQALRALSTSLRNILPDLAEDSNGNNASQAEPEGGKSWRSERLEYVESATRKHLERVRGLELGKDGEIVDGEWQGEGRNVGPEEVKSLESVAALFARPLGSRQGDSAIDEA